MKLNPIFPLLVILSLALSACASLPGTRAQGSDFPDLKGTSWVLVEINGQPVLENSLPTLSFDEGALGGNGSCNTFGGDYSQEGDKLTVGPLFSTLMYCDGISDQEQAYLAALQAAAAFRIEGGRLSLLDANGAVSLVFDPQDTSLEGKTWLLTAYAIPNGVTTLVPNTEITAQFAEGNMSGSAGCNNYFASYTLDGNKVTFGPAGATKMFCETPEGLMQQETDFLNAIGLAVSYRVEGRMLSFYNAEGQTVLQFLQGE